MNLGVIIWYTAHVEEFCGTTHNENSYSLWKDTKTPLGPVDEILPSPKPQKILEVLVYFHKE